MHRLMIVDDSNIIRRKIERFRDKDKFLVVGSANNGFKAVELFEQCKPEVVTMDLTMPGMDGIRCIEELIQRDPEIKILVISALTDKATGIEALEKGAQGFLSKPFLESELLEALQEITED